METGLRIRVLQGQVRGLGDGRGRRVGDDTFEFPADAADPEQRIVIGRDPLHCTLVFDDALRAQGLGNEHVALRRSLGRYQLDLNTRNRVLVDGKTAFEEQELVGTRVLQLGDAVRLEVTVVDDRTATVDGGRRLAQPHETALRTRRLLGALTAAVAALAIGGWWWKVRADREAVVREQAALAQTRLALARLSPVSDDVIADVKRSIYAIVIRTPDGGEDIQGTGWSAPGGRIVTDAHVVDVTDPDTAAMLEAGAKLLARSTVPPFETHEILEIQPHPGYLRFRQIIAGLRPMQKSIGGFRDVDVDAACDAAVLTVSNTAALAPPLTIANRAELADLRAGQPIAMVGFPEEGMQPSQVARPEPVSQKASIVRLTDFFMEHREDGSNQLVQHSLPVTGGASGSPIIDGQGRVIALVTAINPLFIPKDAPGSAAGDQQRQRIMNPALVNFGQRADFVLDLLEARADEALAGYVADWELSIGRLERLSDQVVPFLQTTLSELMGRDVEPTVIREISGEAPETAEPAALFAVGSALPRLVLPRGLLTVVAIPERNVDIDIALQERGHVLEDTLDGTPRYHGQFLFENRFAGRKTGLAAWVQVEEAGSAAVPYAATLIDWGIDPDDYLERCALRLGRDAVRNPEAEPERTLDLDEVVLEGLVRADDGEPFAVGEVAWSLDAPAVCVLTCRPSIPVRLGVHEPDGPPIVQPCENPVFTVAHPGGGREVRLQVVAQHIDPDGAPPRVAVRIHAWPLGAN